MNEASSGVVLAPILPRIVAFAIDFLIMAAILSLGLSAGVLNIEKGRPADAATLAAIAVVAAVYYIAFLATASATPGKMAMRMHVAYRDGGRLQPDTAILRGMVLMVENLFPIALFVSFAVMVMDSERRALHDRVAGTVVVSGRLGERA
jgi:uncharacterized RDD family membrane protein YckC